MDTAIQEHTISEELLPRGLAALGNIKIGRLRPKQKSTGGKEFQPPTKLDFFLVTTRTRGDDNNFIVDQAVHEILGEKPTELDIRLPFDAAGENFYAQMVHYEGRTRKVRQCDGETCLMVETEVEEPCARRGGRTCPCKPYGRLSVILEAAPTYGGLHVFRTTSWESVRSIQTALKMFEEQFGSLRGLPLKMKLYPAEVTYKQDGQTRTSTAYKVAVVLRASYDEARAAALTYHRQSQLARREILQLAAGTAADLDAIDAADEEGIAKEYFPNGGDATEASPDSPLARMNQEIVQGVPEDETQEDDGDDDGADQLLEEVTSLIGELAERGQPLTDSQRARFEEGMQARDVESLEQGVEWLKDKLAKTPPTSAELKRLADLRQKARGIGSGLTLDDEGELDEVQRLKDGASVREWIRKLENIIDGGQADLLDGED